MEITTKEHVKEVRITELGCGDLFARDVETVNNVLMVLDVTSLNEGLIQPIAECGVPILQLSTGVIHVVSPKAMVIKLDGRLETWQV